MKLTAEVKTTIEVSDENIKLCSVSCKKLLYYYSLGRFAQCELFHSVGLKLFELNSMGTGVKFIRCPQCLKKFKKEKQNAKAAKNK